MIAPKEYKEIIAMIKQHLGEWRAFVIAIDGTDYSGKSSLSRYLAWQLEMSVIETDLCRKKDVQPIETDPCILKRLIDARLKLNRPVIVEGIVVLESLKKIKIKPDFLIKMNNSAFEGSRMFQEKAIKYESEYAEYRKPDYELKWNSDELCS